MKLRLIQNLLRALLTFIITVAASSAVFASATITIQNNDPAGTGFNDPTPVAPVGGNSGTTLGEQRLIAFQFAAGIWGATINSVPAMTVRANWSSTMPCTLDSATLGSAGSIGMRSDFPNAPFLNTWYSSALANALAGTDLSVNPEIAATFNSRLGTTGCLETSGWYLGLDGNHGNNVDLVTVLLHELSHGLGFQTFTDESTGAQASGMPTIYDRFLRDNSTGLTWDQMTNPERAASAINTGNLVWAGPNAISAVPSVLQPVPHLRVNSPPSIVGSYTVGTAEFGPPVSSPGVTGDVSATVPVDGCSAITNAGSVNGKIAFIDRGDCNFTVKVKNAQNAGALAVIVGNVASSPDSTIAPGMGGDDNTIVIPSVSLNLADANTLRGQLANGINATITQDSTDLAGADSANRPLMFAPNPVQDGSSISHFDRSAFPNQLMEPIISGDLSHNVVPPFDLTFSLLRDLGWTGAAGATPAIQFSQPTFSIVESQASMNVMVSRTGDTTGTATVDYATSDTAGTQTCPTTNGQASSRCDYITTLGTLTFAAGETSRTILVPIVDDVHNEGSENFTMTLSNVSGATLGTPATATLTITESEAGGANPSDTANFFVRQHYLDFLNREPDAGGLAFWSGEITSCGADAQCIDVKRVNVSAAFFLSIEFQETGYLVYRIYKSAFGNLTPPPGAPVPVRFTDFLRGTQRIGQGVQVGIGDWQGQLEANKQAFVLAFVQRSDFQTAYPNSMTAAQFVDQMNANAGGALSATERNNLIAMLTVPADVSQRAAVLRAVAEDQTLRNAETNRAFVLMQYFGYLRRNPDDVGFDGNPDPNFNGFNFWLNKLNQFNGNFVDAEMVKAFIASIEYRQRFGQ